MIKKFKFPPPGQARRAALARCRDCRSLVVAGLDDDQCAWPAIADPDPLSRAGELAALAWGRGVCRISGGRLYRLLPWQINKPAGPFETSVADHICGQEIPASWKAEIQQPKETTKGRPSF